MIHLKNSGYLPNDASLLLARADTLTSDMDVIVRDTRVSSKYLEFDISVDKQNFNLLVQKLEPIGLLDNARQIIDEKIDKVEAIKMAKEYFNDERFWECHEVLEGVWKKSREDEKDLLQGIILVVAAFVHYQKNEKQICLSILKRAIEKINATGKYYEIDIDLFKKRVSDIIASEKIMMFMI